MKAICPLSSGHDAASVCFSEAKMHDEESEQARKQVRMDKWLWAARFYKTRSFAAEALRGGKVEVNGARAKPSRNVRIGDSLNIRRGPYTWIVIVKACSMQRGPSTEAQLLYEETEDSIRKRQEVAAQLKLEHPQFGRTGRPSKKDRRTILKFTKRGR